jgi:hypothetical protein
MSRSFMIDIDDAEIKQIFSTEELAEISNHNVKHDAQLHPDISAFLSSLQDVSMQRSIYTSELIFFSDHLATKNTSIDQLKCFLRSQLDSNSTEPQANFAIDTIAYGLDSL